MTRFKGSHHLVALSWNPLIILIADKYNIFPAMLQRIVKVPYNSWTVILNNAYTRIIFRICINKSFSTIY